LSLGRQQASLGHWQASFRCIEMKFMPTRLWAWPWELRRNGVLGVNERNLRYLFEFNPRSSYRLVDDKVVTKTMCRKQGIPAPETYAVIERFGDLQNLAEIIGDRDEFVIKPASGAGGRGVLVIVGRQGRHFKISDRDFLSLAELRYHISTTLSGLYSLGEQPDRVIVEQRIVPLPMFEKLAVGGTPDTRIILFRGSPVMAMLRLPTQASRGRANLHQGAAAVGIDLGSGKTFGGVFRNRAITVHPDTGAALDGIEIPYMAQMLEAAKNMSRVIGLGYIGVDILIDSNRGPMVLEVNARPGLAIQIANRCGLLPRLMRSW
jgi:alpha-L-glutamate ligase-like protein